METPESGRVDLTSVSRLRSIDLIFLLQFACRDPHSLGHDHRLDRKPSETRW